MLPDSDLEAQDATLSVDPRAFAHQEVARQKWCALAGGFRLQPGFAADGIRQAGALTQPEWPGLTPVLEDGI